MDMTDRSRASGRVQAAALAGRNGRARPAARLELHIDELVLHGFPRAERFAIGDALEHALARHFAEQGVPGALTRELSIDRLDIGTFAVPAPAQPGQTGQRMAHALYRGLDGARADRRESATSRGS